MGGVKKAEREISFSVIIPLYNKERHIERALRSVFSQTVKADQIIIVDDGSADAGVCVVEKFPDPESKIVLLKQKNSGVSVARNVGVAHAQGTHIAFLDADDAWDSHYLDEVSSIIRKYPNAGAYCTAYRIVQPNGKVKSSPLWFIRHKRHSKIENYFKSAFHGSPVWTSATVVPKKFFDKLGGFTTNVGRGEDLELWWRIAEENDIIISRMVSATYYKDADNRSIETMSPRIGNGIKPQNWWGIDKLQDLKKSKKLEGKEIYWINEWLLWLSILSAYGLPAGNTRDNKLKYALKSARGHYANFYARAWMLKNWFRRVIYFDSSH